MLKHRLKKTVELVFLCAFACVTSGDAYAYRDSQNGAPSIELKTFKTHSRLLVRIDQGVTTKWRQSKEGFLLVLEGVGFVDLGASFGAEEEWASRYQGLKDERMKDLFVSEAPEGVMISGRWIFPKGEAELASPKMERFDYRRQEPPAYIVDFWVKEGVTKKVAAKKKKVKRKLAAAKKVKRKTVPHSKAPEENLRIIRELEEVVEFCKMPLSEKTDVFP